MDEWQNFRLRYRDAIEDIHERYPGLWIELRDLAERRDRRRTTDTPPARGRRIGSIVMDAAGTGSPFAPARGAETSGGTSGPITQTEVIWATSSCR